MAEQRFGIFGKDVTRYIPPELRPVVKFAHEMNPVVGFQRAGQALKEGKYGESALETGILAAAPVAYFGKTLIKPSVTAGIDALKEMFLLGAADEVAKKAPVKKGVSRRDVLAGMGATVLVPPVAKGIGDLIPATGAAKVAKVGLKGPIGSAAAKANRLRDLYFGTEKALKGNPLDQMEQALKQSEEMDAVTLSMNKELSDFLKGKNYDDFMKLKDEELIALGEIQQDITHVMRTGTAPKDVIYSGDPLRDKNVSEALSKAINDRGLRGKVTDLSRARMFESIAAKREARKRAGFTGESAIDLPGDIIPKMFPSEGIIKKMVPTGPKSPSLFPTEPAFHYSTYTDKQIKNFSIEKIEDTYSDADTNYSSILGLHVGTPEAAAARSRSNLQAGYFTKDSDEIRYSKPTDQFTLNYDFKDEDMIPMGSYYALDIDTSKPFKNPNSKTGLWTESELDNYIIEEIDRNPTVSALYKQKSVETRGDKIFELNEKIGDAEKEAFEIFRKGLASRGFTNIPYINAVEDRGSISQIMLIDRPKGDKVIKSKITAEPMAEGGIAGLSDVARDMFKGPKGIGTYESFMVG